jgi:3-oxoacyl-[acyl-carrier-protein] synthase-1
MVAQHPVYIVATGVVAPVGLTARAFATACRAGVSGVGETRFRDRQRQWIRGAAVPLPRPLGGTVKLARMCALALEECLTAHDVDLSRIGDVFLCVSEPDRPGRPPRLEQTLARDLAARVESDRHGARLHVIAAGKVGFAAAIEACRSRLAANPDKFGLIVGVDSFLESEALAVYDADDRVLTSNNSNGFIPGEAASAILVTAGSEDVMATCHGVATTREEAVYGSGIPLKGDGLTAAVREAISEAHLSENAVDFRIADLSGEQYYFREASLAASRLFRAPRERFPLWLPAESVGETGAAAGGLAAAWFADAVTHGYSPGRTAVCHFSDADGKRAALVLSGECTDVE